MADTVSAFRIAMRTTDDGWWVARLAKLDTLDDSIEIGRIRRRSVDDPETRRLFLEAMRAAMTSTLRDLKVHVTSWKQSKPVV